jgi:hypothetical protein
LFFQVDKRDGSSFLLRILGIFFLLSSGRFRNKEVSKYHLPLRRSSSEISARRSFSLCGCHLGQGDEKGCDFPSIWREKASRLLLRDSPKAKTRKTAFFLKKGRFFLGKALFFPLLKQERNFEKTPAKANPFS